MTTDKDWALLLQLISNSKSVLGRTRLQKMVFLAEKEEDTPFSLSFSKYYYGPYSSELQDTIDSMVASELVQEESYSTPTGDEGYKYTLTPHGAALLEQIGTGISRGEKKGIDRIVRKYSHMPLRELLDHVYSNYVDPDGLKLLP